jgi:hypothetical protein
MVMLDSVLVEDLDNYRAPVSMFFHASRCSSEIVGLREAGIVSAVQQLAHRCQCPSLVSAFVTFHRVSPACQVAVLSDVVAPKFGADPAMVGGELSSVRCLTWSRVIVGVGRTGGLASAVAG